MTWETLKSETLKLLEEYNEKYDDLTDDNDIVLKIIPAANKILFELSRLKKILKYEQIDTSEGQILDLNTLNKFYQLKLIRGVEFDSIDTIVTFNTQGTATVYYYAYPTLITENTEDDFELELSLDVLNIAPVGIAGTILMTDISNKYGSIFLNRYEQMINRLDNRASVESIEIVGGIDV